VYRASLLMATGEPEKALADLQRALAMKPQAWRPRFIKAEVLRRLGRAQDADAVLAEARALPRPNDSFERELAALQERIADPLRDEEHPSQLERKGQRQPRPMRPASRPKRPQPGEDTSPGRNGNVWN
jgi:hypothetical protein